jgi:hypothetical protein
VQTSGGKQEEKEDTDTVSGGISASGSTQKSNDDQREGIQTKEQGRVKTFEDGELLLRQDDPVTEDSEIFVIRNGAVSVRVEGVEIAVRQSTYVGEGAVLGEKRTADVVAKGRVVCEQYTREEFLRSQFAKELSGCSPSKRRMQWQKRRISEAVLPCLSSFFVSTTSAGGGSSLKRQSYSRGSVGRAPDFSRTKGSEDIDDGMSGGGLARQIEVGFTAYLRPAIERLQKLQHGSGPSATTDTDTILDEQLLVAASAALASVATHQTDATDDEYMSVLTTQSRRMSAQLRMRRSVVGNMVASATHAKQHGATSKAKSTSESDVISNQGLVHHFSSSLPDSSIEQHVVENGLAHFIDALYSDPGTLLSVEKEFDQMVLCFLHVGERTDLNNEDHVHPNVHHGAVRIGQRDLVSKLATHLRHEFVPRIGNTGAGNSHSDRPSHPGGDPTWVVVATLKLMQRMLELQLVHKETGQSILEPFFQESAFGQATAGKKSKASAKALDLSVQLRLRRSFQLQQESMDRYATKLVHTLICNTPKLVRHNCWAVLEGALKLGCRLLWYGNSTVQSTLLKEILAEKEGLFFAGLKLVAVHTRGAVRAARAHRQKVEGVVMTEDEAYGSSFEDASNAQSGVGVFAGDGGGESIGVSEDTENAGSIGSCFSLLWRLLQLMCEGHNTQMQRLMHVQPESRHSYDLIKEACLVCNLLCSDSIVMAQTMGQAEVGLLGFVLDFLIETVQGPCPEAQLVIAQSGVISAIALLMSTNLAAAGEFSQLRAQNRIVLPSPLPAQDHRCRRRGWQSQHMTKRHKRDPSSHASKRSLPGQKQYHQYDHNQHTKANDEREQEVVQRVYQYVGKPVKNVKQAAITLLLGLIEGRADAKVHSLIIAALDVGCIRNYLSCIFATQLTLQSLTTHSSELKCDEAMVEQFLRRQTQDPTSADSKVQSIQQQIQRVAP